MVGGIQNTTGGWCILWATGIQIMPIKKTAIKVANTIWTLKCINANFIKPAVKPNIKTVGTTPLGILNKMPKPKAAIPDQAATSNKFKMIVSILMSLK